VNIGEQERQWQDDPFLAQAKRPLARQKGSFFVANEATCMIKQDYLHGEKVTCMAQRRHYLHGKTSVERGRQRSTPRVVEETRAALASGRRGARGRGVGQEPRRETRGRGVGQEDEALVKRTRRGARGRSAHIVAMRAA
jgi:hypothetical protein